MNRFFEGLERAAEIIEQIVLVICNLDIFIIRWVGAANQADTYTAD